tara:strand:+ start:184 stop:591 length:408 start_codon:yes stop_codon:yes gene_type:complete
MTWKTILKYKSYDDDQKKKASLLLERFGKKFKPSMIKETIVNKFSRDGRTFLIKEDFGQFYVESISVKHRQKEELDKEEDYIEIITKGLQYLELFDIIGSKGKEYVYIFESDYFGTTPPILVRFDADDYTKGDKL